MLIVKKFGGSSVADADKVRRVAGIIADDYAEGHDVVVVCCPPWATRRTTSSRKRRS